MNKIILSITTFVSILLFASTTLAQEATNSGDIEQHSLSKPTAYIGSITDITESTINLRRFIFDNSNVSGEMLQIMFDKENTEFIDDEDDEELKSDDIAIGDFIIAVGTVEREGVLNANKIIVTTTPESEQKNTFFANILELGDDEITFKNITDESEVLATYNEDSLEIYTKRNGKTEEVVLTDIEENQKLVVFTKVSDDDTEVLSIYVIPSQESSEPSLTPVPEE